MADFYGTLPDALVHMAIAAGGAAWTETGVTDTAREAALIRASRALDGRYGRRFPGQRTGGRAQALEWPRTGAKDACTGEVISDDEVPVDIERATYALALVELQSPGSSTPTVTMGRVAKRQKAGQVEREFFSPDEGVQVTVDNLRPVLTEVEDALRCLLVPKGATQCLLRV